MITAWMLQSVAVAALLAVSARAGEGLLALYRLPRRWVWAMASALAVVLPVLALLLPAAAPAGEQVATHVTALESSANVAPPTPVAASRLGVARDVVASSVSLMVSDPRLGGVLGATWLGATVLLLGLLGLTMFRFARARRAWQQRVVADTPVLVTGDAGPAVIGVLRPSIIIPSWLLATDAERQRMVVQHEREHVRRGDHALLAAAATVAALLPWNLPLQWMLRRMRTAVEIDCDRRVLAAGTPAREYGAMLIDIASRTHRLPLAVALTGGETDLERRIRAMTWKTPRFRSVRAAAGAVGAAALVLVACEVDLMDPAFQDSTVGEAVDAAAAADDRFATMAGNVRYTLDGQPVSLDEIRDMDMSRIASAEVVRGEVSASGVPEVRILTHEYAAVLQAQTADAPESAEARRRSALELHATAAQVQAASTTNATAEARRRAAVEADVERAVAARGAARPAGTPVAVTRAEQAAVEAERRAVVVERRAAEARLRMDGRVETGAAGEPVEFRVERMAVEAATQQSPLYIVDGVIVSHTRIDLDALDIESIEIIKGAAAAQLYGSRAANGIINITTKRR